MLLASPERIIKTSAGSAMSIPGFAIRCGRSANQSRAGPATGLRAKNFPTGDTQATSGLESVALSRANIALKGMYKWFSDDNGLHLTVEVTIRHGSGNTTCGSPVAYGWRVRERARAICMQ